MKSGIDRLLDESAGEWQVSRLVARMHFWLPLAVSATVLVSKVYQPIYHLLIQEDGLVEWTTFFLALIAACAAGWITYCRWTDGYSSQAVLFGLFTGIGVSGREEIRGARGSSVLRLPSHLRI
jgi:hypothetical protein